MYTLDYYFPKSKGKEFGAKYLVLDAVEKPQTRHYLNLKCKDCDYEFSQRANSVFLGVISCKCSKSYRKTKEEFCQQVQTECEQRCIEVISLDYCKPLSDNRGTFKCLSCNGVWTTATSSILLGTGCVHCVGKYKPTSEEYIKKIKDELSDNFTLIEYPENIALKSRVVVKCNHCEVLIDKSVSRIIHGKSHCYCRAPFGFRNSRINFLYLLSVVVGTTQFHKIGITKDITRRISEISRENSADVNLLSYWQYPPYSSIREDEQTLKDLFCDPSEHNSEGLIVSGHTELIPNNSIPVVWAIQKLQRRNRGGFTS